MVNPQCWSSFQEHVSDEFKGLLGGEPAVYLGGMQMDHYKGLASTLKTRVVPFAKESYQPSEFTYGYIPVSNKILPYLYFQFTILDVKGKNIPGVGNFGAIADTQIPETYVAPYADWKHRLLPLSAFTDDRVSASKVFKSKVKWTAFLEAVNNDKASLKALNDQWNSSRIGDFKVTMDSMRIPGFVQLAPYKGFTVITLESTPAVNAAVNRPRYDLKKHHDNLLKIATHALAHPQKGEEVGQLYLNQGNAAMMDLMVRGIDEATGTASEASSTQQ